MYRAWRTVGCLLVMAGVTWLSWRFAVLCDGEPERSALMMWYAYASALSAFVGTVLLLAAGASAIYD